VNGDLLGLDRTLDELAAGGDPAAAGAAGEAEQLAALAAELRAATPAPPEGAAARGRAALLASAAGSPGPQAHRRRWSARARVLAAAAALAVAVPAALAGHASPGTPLWPLRQAGQQLRLDLTGDPVARAHLRLDTAELLLAAARDSGGYRRAGLAACRREVQAAMAQLGGHDEPEAAAERDRAEKLLAGIDGLERAAGNQHRRGPDPERDGDRSGPGRGGSGGPGRDGGSGDG
jgi:hypothetical protein